MTAHYDGRVDIVISEDKMKVLGSLYPATGGGRPVRLDEVQKVLEDLGVSFGLRFKNIREAVETCQKGETLSDVVFAEGRPPRDEVPEYIKVKRRLFEPLSLLPADKRLNIDYKMISPFVLVDKDEVLAVRKKGRDGVPGNNVLGDEVPFKKKQMKTIVPGTNTEERDGRIYSLLAGCFEMHGEALQVNETLVVKGNVDYSTGHIMFGGDVVIFGTIKDGFRVAVGGSVYCKKTMDASEVLAKKELLVEGGIIGRKRALVRVHGHVETRYIESCDVESLLGISVKSSILHSPIYTLGRLEMGKKGTIIDSRIYAEQGVSAAFIGREGSPPSQIRCGVSFVAERKLKHVQNQYDRLSRDLERAEALDRGGNRVDILRKLELAVERMERHQKRFLKELYTAPDAEVRVSGAVFPGTLIVIYGKEYYVTQKTTRSRFYYSEESDCVKVAPL